MPAVEVIVSDEFVGWYQALDDTTSDDVDVAVGVLESQGVALGAPRSSEIKGASFALRELRFQIDGAAVQDFLRIRSPATGRFAHWWRQDGDQ